MALIYIVEDDKNIQEIECYALRSAGFDIRAFSDANELGRAMSEEKPDLLLLDIMLPGENGLSVLKKLRNNRETEKLPIIMVTAKSTEIDTVKGLDMGADDYITKPFGIMELMSRVKALLRRTCENASSDTTLTFKGILINDERHICLVNGEQAELTYKEYRLLKLFLSNIGIVLTREVIMNSVWGEDFMGETRTVDAHVKTLRRKLGDEGASIVTIRNVGYKME